MKKIIVFLVLVLFVLALFLWEGDYMNPTLKRIIITPQMLNVKNFGAKGDGVTDDTAAIQAAIDVAATGKSKGKVFIPDGTYQVNPDTSINLKSNVSLQLATNAILRATASSNTNYEIINIVDISNVTIKGGSIIGDRTIHNGTTGEYGHGINITGSNNINISDIAISNCWGDGIYVGSGVQNYCNSVNILRATLNNNRRMGISIISAKNLLLKDSTATNTNGTAPQSGLDLEPDNNTQFLQNIVVDNFKTSGNSGYGICSNFVISGVPTANVSIDIIDHEDSGSTQGTFGGLLNYINAGYDVSCTRSASFTNLVTNGDFSGGTTGWTPTEATLSMDTGRLKALATAVSSGHSVLQNLATAPIVGHKYHVRATYSASVGKAEIAFRNKNAAGTTVSTWFGSTADEVTAAKTITISEVNASPQMSVKLYVYDASDNDVFTGTGQYGLFDNIMVIDMAPFGSYVPTGDELDIYFRTFF